MFFKSLQQFTDFVLEHAYDKGVEDSSRICKGDLTGVGYATEIDNLRHEDS